MRPRTTVQWQWRSLDDELRALGPYLTGRLDVDTKLNHSLANAVEVFEYLRHAAADPTFPNWKERCREDPDLAALLDLCGGIGEIVLSEGFPELPFYRLPPERKAEIRCWVNGFDTSVARWEDFRDLHAQGIISTGIRPMPASKSEPVSERPSLSWIQEKKQSALENKRPCGC